MSTVKNSMRLFKSGISALADRMGYEVRRKRARPLELELSHFESCLHLLMGVQSDVNIVQVGANDGSVNDPLYAFTSRFPDRSRVILVEPQRHLIPYLEENYRFHGAKYIFNGAIGPARELKLYRISKDCWSELVVPHAEGWPIYRAPTGITSADYEHVATWLSHHYRGSLPLSDVIETVTVEAMDVCTLLRRAQLFSRLDVLQVDAESFDDEVIFASNIAELRPLIINFELAHLSAIKASALRCFLADQGYRVSAHGRDGLAIRTELN